MLFRSLRDTAAAAFRATGCDGWTRVDFFVTADMMDTVIERQWSDPTYADQVGDRSLFDIRPRAASMLRLLAYLRDVHGGALPLLRSLGWTDSDQAALEAHLLGR